MHHTEYLKVTDNAGLRLNFDIVLPNKPIMILLELTDENSAKILLVKKISIWPYQCQ